MCEPSHSIIQYNDPNDPPDDDNNMSSQAGAFKIGQLTKGLGKWTKKIRQWMHLSMMGRGHSETIGERSGMAHSYYSDVFTLYEAHWWDRTVKFDNWGPVKYPDHTKELILDCANQYAHQVSIGNLTQLRRFLETSMRNSDRASLYAGQLRDQMLTAKGRKQFDNRLGKIFKTRSSYGVLNTVASQNLDGLVKFVLGFTRKRELLVPEWADDNRIWKPGDGKLSVSS